MRKLTLAVASAITALAPAAFAQTAPDYGYRGDRLERFEPRDRFDRRDTARVVESRPVYAEREECWNPREQRYEPRGDGRTSIGKGAAAGAVLGGVLGHQVDRGEGTAAGAILGGVLGHQLEKRHDRHELDLSNCRMAAVDSTIQGYDVRYRYEGNEYVTRLSHDPGRRLRVGEDVRPDGTPYDNVATASSSTFYR
jgi:uncharacterized protein YcfJ